MTEENRSKGYDQSPDYGIDVSGTIMWLAVGVPVFVVAVIVFGLLLG